MAVSLESGRRKGKISRFIQVIFDFFFFYKEAILHICWVIFESKQNKNESTALSLKLNQRRFAVHYLKAESSLHSHCFLLDN